MPYKVEKSVNLDGAPYQGAEVCIVAADNSQSLGRGTTDANGVFSIDVGEYSGEVKVDVYINGIKPQVKRFMPTLISPPNPLDYILFYDTRNASAQSGINDGQIVSNLTVSKGYPSDATFTANGLVTTTADAEITSSTGSLNSGLRIRSDFTLMARIYPTDLSTSRFIASIQKNNERLSGNYLWGVAVSGSGRLFFTQEHGAGINSDAVADVGSELSINQYYTIAVTRRDNGDGTNDVSFYIDGVFINTVTGLVNPNGGTNSLLYVAGAEADNISVGFMGTIKKLIVGDFVATDAQIMDAHLTWSA